MRDCKVMEHVLIELYHNIYLGIMQSYASTKNTSTTIYNVFVIKEKDLSLVMHVKKIYILNLYCSRSVL